MSDSSNDNIVEEREEHMISPVDGERNRETTLRLAHFLTPSMTSSESLLLDVFASPLSPSIDLNFSSSKMESKVSNLEVNFPGWRFPPKDWKTWTDRMHSLHHSAWKEAGICDAIMNSTYKIHRNDELIFGFAEKWCPDTNTFLFPWGEATITLEDVMILGGYSVLGDPVFSPIESSELEEVGKKLLSARSELCKTKAKKACQTLWLRNFMDSGNEIEHEAFLALWLSRFVFPSKSRGYTIGRHVLPTAVHLARGIKIALAPAVLADLYANLSKMNEALITSKWLKNSSNKQDYILELSISAPFQLVQIWVWERFSSLRPNPMTFEHHQPRFAKWNDCRIKGIGDVKLAIDGAAKYFHWRPYTMGCKNSFPLGIYNEEARWVSVGSCVDEELEILVQWLRVSELVGIDSDRIEQYLPHRVAMQFGFDQDVPGYVARASSNQITAWENYTRKIRDERLYVPPDLFESDVTTRYVEWWKNRTSAWRNDPIDTIVHGVNCKRSKKMKLLSSLLKEFSNGGFASSNLIQKSNMDREGSDCKKAVSNQVIPKSSGKKLSPNSAGKKSHIGSLISSYLHGKPKTVGTSISHCKYGHVRAKLSRGGNHGKGRVKHMVRLTGSLYKTTLKNRLNSKSLGKKVSVSSSEKNLKNDAVVPPGFPPKSNHVGMGHSEDNDGNYQTELLRTKPGRKDKAQNMVRLTGSEYKKTLANRLRLKGIGKRMLLISAGNESDNDALVPPGFYPKHTVVDTGDSCNEDGQTQAKRSRTDLDTKDRSQRDSLVPLSFLPKSERVTGDSDDQNGQYQAKGLKMETDGEGKAQKDYQLESPSSVIVETAMVQNVQEEPLEINWHENDKGSSSTVLECEEESRPGVQVVNGFINRGSGSASGGSETQSFCHQPQCPSSAIPMKADNKAAAESNRKFNLSTRDGNSCSSYAFEDLAFKLEARIRNLERIVAGYKRKHAITADDDEDCE